MARVLVVDDDRKIVSTVSLYLEREGHTVATAGSGAEALAEIRANPPDLIILDLMLPGIDGLDIAKLVRLESDVPVVMVTARSLEEDALAGFEAGADDYVKKPFSPRELMARVRAVLRRRMSPQSEEAVLRVGALRIESLTHSVTRGDRQIDLTPTEFRILEVLAANPGRVYSRGDLVSKVYGPSYVGLDRSIDTHVSNLRRKLRSDGKSEILHTVHGIGYKLEATDGAQ